MKKIGMMLVAVLLLLTSCDVIDEIRLQAKADFKADSVVTLPFTYSKQLIVVNAALLDATQQGKFIFDTGAFQSKVVIGLAEDLGMQTVSRRSNGTAQGISREIEIVRVDKVRMSGANFFHIGAGKIAYDPKSYSPCVAKDGIIGSNLIKLAHWQIDYQNLRIKVAEKPFIPDGSKKHSELKFTTSFLSGVPKVNIEVAGQVVEEVIFDTGYNGGLVLPYRYARMFQAGNTRTLIDQSTAGIFGINRDTLLVKQLPVKLGGAQATLPVEFSSLNKALIGNDLLEHFTLYLDYDTHQITLENISPMHIEKIKTFIPGVLNDSLWIVNRTNPQLPVQIGDTLQTVNGLKPGDLFDNHCDYFFGVADYLRSDTLIVKTGLGDEIKLPL